MHSEADFALRLLSEESPVLDCTAVVLFPESVLGIGWSRTFPVTARSGNEQYRRDPHLKTNLAMHGTFSLEEI